MNFGNADTTTAAEALNWLETHGITMISTNETPTMVGSSLESGQILTLTGLPFFAVFFFTMLMYIFDVLCLFYNKPIFTNY